MAFPKDRVNELLAAVHRRCCICHRFCGVKVEVDHIEPRGEGGGDDIENALPVCFECHAEIHSYNDRHPRGRKFHPEELSRHKKQWIQACKDHPNIFTAPPPLSEVGPLQALIDELEFNAAVSRYDAEDNQGCLFLDVQFRRAVAEGAIALVRDDLKAKIINAYVAIGRANQFIKAVMMQEIDGNAWSRALQRATPSIRDAGPQITAARDALLKFLGREGAEEV